MYFTAIAEFGNRRLDLARPRRYLAVLPSHTRPSLFGGD